MVSTSAARVIVAGSVLLIGAVFTLLYLSKKTSRKKGKSEEKTDEDDTIVKKSTSGSSHHGTESHIHGKRKHPNDDFINRDVQNPKKPHEMPTDPEKNGSVNKLMETFDVFRKELDFVKDGVKEIVGKKNQENAEGERTENLNQNGLRNGISSDEIYTKDKTNKKQVEREVSESDIKTNGKEPKSIEIDESVITPETTESVLAEVTVSKETLQPKAEQDPEVVQKASTESLNGVSQTDKKSVSETKMSLIDSYNDDGSYKKFSEEEITDALLVSQTSPGILSGPNAEVLSALITHPDPKLQDAALNGINRCSTFVRNQNLFREHGCLSRLSNLLYQQRMSKKANPKVVTSVANAITNLSSNEENHKKLEDCVSTLVDLTLEDDTGESVCLSSLKALTNLSLTNQHHTHYTRAVQRLYNLVDTGSPSIRLQAAKVLVNLSCNPEIVPHMLAAKAPSCLIELLKQGTDEDLLLRWTTLLANILTTTKEQKLTSASLPPDDKAPSPETMYTALYGVNSGQLKSKVYLLTRHKNENICHQASKVYQVITKM